MNPKLKIVLYGLGAFAFYLLLLVVLRLTSGSTPEDANFFDLFSTKDFLLGLSVAIVLTISYARKRRLK